MLISTLLSIHPLLSMKVSSAVLLFSLSSLTAAAVAAKDNDNLKSSVAGQPANLMVDRFKSKAKDTIFGRKAVSRPASGGGVVGEEQQSSPSSSPATLVTTPSAPPAKLPSSPACDGRWVIRKEIRQMKQDGDFDGFVKAFKQMATDGSLQQLVTWHKYQGTRYMHGQNPRFLPWHRIYLNKFEEELTKRGAKYLVRSTCWNNS